MVDRDKVIKELEHILNEARGDYLDFADITVDFGEEILALLKEQEEQKNLILKVVWDVLHEGVSTDTVADQDWVYEQIRNRIEKTY